MQEQYRLKTRSKKFTGRDLWSIQSALGGSVVASVRRAKHRARTEEQPTHPVQPGPAHFPATTPASVLDAPAPDTDAASVPAPAVPAYVPDPAAAPVSAHVPAPGLDPAPALVPEAAPLEKEQNEQKENEVTAAVVKLFVTGNVGFRCSLSTPLTDVYNGHSFTYTTFTAVEFRGKCAFSGARVVYTPRPYYKTTVTLGGWVALLYKIEVVRRVDGLWVVISLDNGQVVVLQLASKCWSLAVPWVAASQTAEVLRNTLDVTRVRVKEKHASQMDAAFPPQVQGKRKRKQAKDNAYSPSNYTRTLKVGDSGATDDKEAKTSKKQKASKTPKTAAKKVQAPSVPEAANPGKRTGGGNKTRTPTGSARRSRSNQCAASAKHLQKLGDRLGALETESAKRHEQLVGIVEAKNPATQPVAVKPSEQPADTDEVKKPKVYTIEEVNTLMLGGYGKVGLYERMITMAETTATTAQETVKIDQLATIRQALRADAVANPPPVSGCAKDEADWADAVKLITAKVPELEDLMALSLQDFKALDQCDNDQLMGLVPFLLRVKLQRLQK